MDVYLYYDVAKRKFYFVASLVHAKRGGGREGLICLNSSEYPLSSVNCAIAAAVLCDAS
jgi:hypothetical protein